jgi:site-specific recombinase XerD
MFIALQFIIHGYVAKVDTGKTGSCHLLRHTMATLTHDYGALAPNQAPAV